MPIYEYKCENGHVFDVMQRMSDDPLTSCTECGAPVKKVLHPVGISFKGSGFYSTDYTKKGPKEPATKNGDTGAEKPDTTEKKGAEKGGAEKGSSSTEKAAKQD